MKRSQIVLALANIASKGKYEVTPAGARQMDQVFELVSNLINELEAAEEEAALADALDAEEKASE